MADWEISSISDFTRCVQFHGHTCPGLAIGFQAAKTLMKRLGVRRASDEELVAVVETDTCGADAIQVMTGCTFGKGNFIFKDYGKIKMTRAANWCPRIVFQTIFFFLILPLCYASDLIPIRTHSTGYQPQLQVLGNRIYYVWHEYEGPFRQIFTAEMNADGTGWKAEKRTSGQFDKVFPQLQVIGNKIYYVRQQPDATKNRQIWTMEMNIDGTEWKEVQRTNTPFDKQFPQIQVVGNKIYYTWNESDGKYRQIWTAEMNVDGTGWNATKRTSTSFDKFEPQFRVIEDKIYFVWRESDGAHYQIWTGLMSRDGTGWRAFKRTTTPFDKHNPQLEVQEGRIYLTWHEADRPDWRKARYQIWTASMKIDGTEWQAIRRTDTPFDKYTPQLRVFSDKIYYVWEESDGKYRQIWTAVSGKDGTGWRGEKRTGSPRGKYDPQFQLVGNKTHYVWHENHGSAEPIWVAVETITE